MADFDGLDTAILAALQVDARRTNRDVAAAVGVAPTTALDRTRALRDRGVISGARLEVDLAAIGRPLQALVAIRIRPPIRANIERFRSCSATRCRPPVAGAGGTDAHPVCGPAPDYDAPERRTTAENVCHRIMRSRVRDQFST